MDTPFIFTLFEGLDRKGPGSDACTNRMFNIPSPLQILGFLISVAVPTARRSPLPDSAGTATSRLLTPQPISRIRSGKGQMRKEPVGG